MKKLLFSSIFLLFSFLSFAQGTAPDWATKAGSFGIGLDPTLRTSKTNTDNSSFTTSALAFAIKPRYSFTNKLLAEIAIGYGTLSQHSVQTDTLGFEWEERISGINFGVGIQQVLLKGFNDRATLSAIFGVNIFNASTEFTNGGQPTVEGEQRVTTFGLGLRGEWFPTKHLSFLTETGLHLSFFAEADVTQLVNTDNNGFGESEIIVFGVGDTFGSAGVTFWFK